MNDNTDVELQIKPLTPQPPAYSVSQRGFTQLSRDYNTFPSCAALTGVIGNSVTSIKSTKISRRFERIAVRELS